MKQYKYYIKGTVMGSRGTDWDTEDVSSHELVDYRSDIEELFTRDPDDNLAQYISEGDADEDKLYGVVTEIWVGVKVIDHALYSWTEVSATRELTDEEKKILLNYLTGQFSDGYGEGLEQNAFYSDTEVEECEEYDEQTGEYFYEEYDVDVNMYLHLWQYKGFHLEFVEPDKHTSWLEYAVEDGDITNDELFLAKKIQLNINGEDYGLFLGQIKEFIPLDQIKRVGYYGVAVENDTDFDGAYLVTLRTGAERVFGWKDFIPGLKEVSHSYRPQCKLIGEDGNIFNLTGIARRTLKSAGFREKADEMTERVTKSKSYAEALAIISEYVEVI